MGYVSYFATVFFSPEKIIKMKHFSLSENYTKLFKANGFQDIRTYRYWHEKNKCLDFEGMLEDLNNAPENAVIVLQACAHNPTGCDPSKEQWMRISDVVKVTH